MKCPICNGSGEFDIEPYANREVKTVAEARRFAAKIMRDKGYSYRQIMKALGLKSPRSVELMVKHTETHTLVLASNCEVENCPFHASEGRP